MSSGVLTSTLTQVLWSKWLQIVMKWNGELDGSFFGRCAINVCKYSSQFKQGEEIKMEATSYRKV